MKHHPYKCHIMIFVWENTVWEKEEKKKQKHPFLQWLLILPVFLHLNLCWVRPLLFIFLRGNTLSVLYCSDFNFVFLRRPNSRESVTVCMGSIVLLMHRGTLQIKASENAGFVLGFILQSGWWIHLFVSLTLNISFYGSQRLFIIEL